MRRLQEYPVLHKIESPRAQFLTLSLVKQFHQSRQPDRLRLGRSDVLNPLNRYVNS